VMVSREVVITAGTFNTPQLLKLSGLGPKGKLHKFQIPFVAELPRVGRNLEDRCEVGIVSKLEDDFKVVAKCTFGKHGDPCLKEFHHGRGPYLSNGLLIGIMKKASVAERDPDFFIFGGLFISKATFLVFRNAPSLTRNTSLGPYSRRIREIATEESNSSLPILSTHPR
jgi:choline dehydrogenase